MLDIAPRNGHVSRKVARDCAPGFGTIPKPVRDDLPENLRLRPVRVKNGARAFVSAFWAAHRAAHKELSLTDKTFAELGVAQPLLRAREAEG
jgi:hypothetical protein